MQPTYLGTTAMAAMLEISSSTLRRLVRNGKIAAMKPIGGQFRFDMDKTIQAYWKIEGEANQ